MIVQKPRALTRKQLRDLQLQLEDAGYREQDLKAAYKAATNAEIAAGIIGFIRQAALGDALISWEQRVDQAVSQIIASGDWTKPQESWLKKIALQMKKELVVDRASMDTAQFREYGGFNRINKTFAGKLEQVLAEINDAVWEQHA